MSALDAYRSLTNLLSNRSGLKSQTASHYSGNFGFNSLSISTAHHTGGEDSRKRMSIEAHEALHAVQAFTQHPARELFRAILQINRFRFLFLGMLLQNGIRMKVGETIFEAASRGIPKHFTPADRQIEDACNTVLSCHEPRFGVSVMNLIEGSALAVEYLNYGGDVAEALDKSVEPYRAAWMAYRQKGGSDAKVYAMLCTASLRYGSIDPIYSDHYPHPSEIFSYLLNFIQHFESIANDRDSEFPNFTAFTPPGDYDEFGPIRAGKPQDFLDDSPPIKSKDHFFPDEMFEEHIETALEEYKSDSRDQIALEDRLFGVSTAIAEAVEAGYVRVADPMEVSKGTDRKLTLDLVQQEVFRCLPGLFIEEVSIRALVDPGFQGRVASVFKEAIAPLLVKPWTGEDKEVPVEVLSHFFDVAESIDWLSIGEGALRIGDTSTFQTIIPTCCPEHDGHTRTLAEICDCENQGGMNRNFGELFGVDLADFMRG